jgi:hypothetical protein
MLEVFTQIIFPPLPKPVEPIITGDNLIEYWITTEGSYQALYVQCPICYTAFRLATVMNETALIEYIKAYPQMYFNSAIRECPDKDTHGTEQWHRKV